MFLGVVFGWVSIAIVLERCLRSRARISGSGLLLGHLRVDDDVGEGEQFSKYSKYVHLSSNNPCFPHPVI